jgi:hypothetical protein
MPFAQLDNIAGGRTYSRASGWPAPGFAGAASADGRRVAGRGRRVWNVVCTPNVTAEPQ